MSIATPSESAADTLRELRARDGRRVFALRLPVFRGGRSGLRYPWRCDERSGEIAVASVSVSRELARAS